MALEYGYFDSEIEGYDEEGMPIFDRAQTSDFMADFFAQLISSGVLADPSDCFQVTAYDGMTVQIAPGYGYIKGRFAYDESIAYLTLEDAPTTSSYKRIDAVVLRANYADRICELVVKTGIAAASPSAPEIIQTNAGDYYELCLALITVSANQTVISNSNITDTRFDSTYCGAVTQLIDHLDTSTFYTQLTAFYEEFVALCDSSYATSLANLNEYLASLQESGDSQLAAIVAVMTQFESDSEESFTEWFEKIKGQLSEDAAGNLQNEIDDLTAYTRAYGVCETGLETQEKTVTCEGFELAEGATVRVKFTAYDEITDPLLDSDGNAITTSDDEEILCTSVDSIAEEPVLNVNSTGAYPIYYRGAPAGAGHFCLNRTYDFVFNGTQFEVIGDLNLSSGYQKATEITLPNFGSYQIILSHRWEESCCGVYLYHTQTSKLMTIKEASAVTLTASGKTISFECEHSPVLHYTQLP